MLVLNRRPGESILIEDDIEMTVLQAKDHTVWLKITGQKFTYPVSLGVSMVSSDGPVRLEIGSPVAVSVDEMEAHVEVASPDHPSVASHAVFSIELRSGQLVKVSETLEIGVAPPSGHGNPSLTLGGLALVSPIRVALIRSAGNSVRLGIDAPGLRVYRKELWETLIATNQAAVVGDNLSDLERLNKAGV